MDFSTPAATRAALEDLIEEGQQLSHLVEEVGELSADADHAYRVAKAAAIARQNERSADKREAAAMPLFEAELLAHRRAEKREEAVKLRLRWLSSAVSGAMTAASGHKLEERIAGSGLSEPDGRVDWRDPDEPLPSPPPEYRR